MQKYRRWFRVWVAELIAIDGVLVPEDRQKIEGYLAWKWGMEAELPGSHPYRDAAPSMPSMTLEKSATLTDRNSNELADSGDMINYTFNLRNTGSLDVSNIVISDPMPGLTLTGNPVTSLPAGSTDITGVGAHTITQTDVTAGALESRATAVGSSPWGTNDVLALSDDDNGTTDANNDADPTNDPTTGIIPADPRLSINKTYTSVTDLNGDGQAGAGDTLRPCRNEYWQSGYQ